ncbi:carbamoyltransferase C-terminal domain-containing protein [Streptomyces sp. NPDC054784]
MTVPDGRHLSVYLSPPGLAHVLEAWVRHDHAVAAWHLQDGVLRLEHYWELERLSGMKAHGVALPGIKETRKFLDGLLRTAGLEPAELRDTWGLPGLETTAPYQEWRALPFPLHSLAHLATAVFHDTDHLNEGGTVFGMAVDDTPDSVLDDRDHPHWYAGCLVRDRQVTVFPVESPAALYSTAVHWFGLREGTLMALATACGAELVEPVDPRVGALDFHHGDAARDETVLAALRQAATAGVRHADERFSERENLISAVMKQVQELGYAVLRRNIDRAVAAHGFDPTRARLAMAGGYALNCPTNRRLLDDYDFAGLSSPPVVNDTGQAYGLGLLGFMGQRGPWPSFRFPGAYLGRGHDAAAAIDRWRDHVAADTAWTDTDVVDDLRHGVIGWFQGRSEIGPRALGNRSLLGDPTRAATKDTLNTVKRRQWWRPVSPVVLAEEADSWFTCRGLSPYMLQTMDIRPHRVQAIPAVAHLDLSARAQTLTAQENPVLHRVLRAFHTATGVPLLANTSMNDKEEPIIDTPDEALAFCLSRGVGVLYLDHRRIELRTDAEGRPTRPLPRSYAPFVEADETQRETILARDNPHGLSPLTLMGWLYSPELTHLDLTCPNQAQEADERVAAKLAASAEFADATHRRLRKRRHLTAAGRPVYTGGWLDSGH